jgi:hypothetical protein
VASRIVNLREIKTIDLVGVQNTTARGNYLQIRRRVRSMTQIQERIIIAVGIVLPLIVVIAIIL